MKTKKNAKALKITPGGVIYEAGSSTQNETGSWRTFRPTVDPKKCVGCSICIKFCPDSCITLVNKKAVMNYRFCKGCGICASVCPFHAIIMVTEEK